MRPLSRPAGRSWTTTFPTRKRASLIVSAGSSERRRRRIFNFSGGHFRSAGGRGNGVRDDCKRKTEGGSQEDCEGKYKRHGQRRIGGALCEKRGESAG